MGRQVLRLIRLDKAEEKPENADEQAEIHDMNAVQHAAENGKIHIAQIGQHDVRLAGECRHDTDEKRQDRRQKERTALYIPL